MLVQSLSCIGGLGMLSSGLVSAQTNNPAGVVVVPTTLDARPPAAAAPIRSVAKVRTNLPTPVQARHNLRLEKTATNSATDYNGAYIDPTQYKIGATGYSAPSRVELSERSTGCKAVLRPGQGLSGSLCGAAAIPRFTAHGSDEDSPRLRHSHPRWARSRAVGVAAISPIRVGPMSVSASGFHPSWRKPTSFPGIMPSSNPVATLSNADTGMQFPLTIPAEITSVFGWRQHPIMNDIRFHSGTDLGAPLGTPVLASYAGQVAIADNMGGYGLTVVLDHNKPVEETLYGHLSQIFVQRGQWVEQGTVIGRVGSTGNSTGPHLHFEIRQMTPSGWIVTDPGVQLQYGMAKLVQALHIAQVPQQPGNGGVEHLTVIGRVGSTGNFTDPHLQFDLRQMTPSVWIATDQKNSDVFGIRSFSGLKDFKPLELSMEENKKRSIFIQAPDFSRGVIITKSPEQGTPNSVDPGAQLQYAMVQLVEALHTAQLSQQPTSKG